MCLFVLFLYQDFCVTLQFTTDICANIDLSTHFITLDPLKIKKSEIQLKINSKLFVN